jgi:hypothetical protein
MLPDPSDAPMSQWLFMASPVARETKLPGAFSPNGH